MLPSSVIFQDGAPMQFAAFGGSVFSSAASVARREGPASRSAVGGKLGALSLRSEKEEKSERRALGICSVKVAPNDQPSTHKSPNKAPEPTTMAVTPCAIVRVIEMKPRSPN